MPANGFVKCSDGDCPSSVRCWRFQAPDRGAEQWWRDFHRPDGHERCREFLAEPPPEAPPPPVPGITDIEPEPPLRRSRPRRRLRFGRRKARFLGPLAGGLAPILALAAIGGLSQAVGDLTGDRAWGLVAGIGAGLLTVVAGSVGLLRWMMRR